MLTKVSKYGNQGVRIITSILAIIFILIGFLTLWDMYRTDLKAFASYDLLKYRPDIENEEPPYLDELLKINPDTSAWVTIYGTNIDYPIFQGKKDSEYLNKDAFGNFSISGSIFLSILNKKDFSDPYNLIYGHHMDNGSMFGDIDKFNKKGFFYNKDNQRYTKEEGVLIMENMVYNLKVIGLLHTDAYDNNVYHSDKSEDQTQEFLNYAQEKCTYFIKSDGVNKILAMSTCDNAVTNARTVLICSMTKRTTPLPTREEEEIKKHIAIGHPMARTYWSFMDLLAMLLCLYIVCPIHLIIKRININRKKKHNNEEIEKLDKHKRKYIILLILIGLMSITFFILTQDMHKPLQMVDIHTPIFIGTAFAAWIIRKLYL